MCYAVFPLLLFYESYVIKSYDLLYILDSMMKNINFYNETLVFYYLIRGQVGFLAWNAEYKQDICAFKTVNWMICINRVALFTVTKKSVLMGNVLVTKIQHIEILNKAKNSVLLVWLLII